MAGGLLAGCAGAAECESLGQKLQIVRARSRGNEKVGGQPQDRPLRENSSRHGTDDPARSSAGRGPQCVSFGASTRSSTHSGKLEIGFVPILVSRVLFVSIRHILFILARKV